MKSIKKYLPWLIVAMAILGTGVLGILLPVQSEAPVFLDTAAGLRPEGVTNFDQISLDGTVDPVLDLTGNQLDLDDDNDTSITADSDDQVDLEINGADEFVFTADQLDVTNGRLVNIGAVGTDFSASGGLALAADLDVGTWVNLSAQTAISLTAAGTITPTGSYQPIQSGTAVTTSTSMAIADGGETGDLLFLRNMNASDAITVDGTGGNVECKADVALGAGDTVILIWNGNDWNCLSSYDNS